MILYGLRSLGPACNGPAQLRWTTIPPKLVGGSGDQPSRRDAGDPGNANIPQYSAHNLPTGPLLLGKMLDQVSQGSSGRRINVNHIRVGTVDGALPWHGLDWHRLACEAILPLLPYYYHPRVPNAGSVSVESAWHCGLLISWRVRHRQCGRQVRRDAGSTIVLHGKCSVLANVANSFTGIAPAMDSCLICLACLSPTRAKSPCCGISRSNVPERQVYSTRRRRK